MANGDSAVSPEVSAVESQNASDAMNAHGGHGSSVVSSFAEYLIRQYEVFPHGIDSIGIGKQKKEPAHL